MIHHPFLHIIIAFAASVPGCGAQEALPGREIPFTYFGHVLLADPVRLTVRRVGALSPAAPAVAVDSAGRIWGRLDRRSVAALDPVSGRIAASVTLPRTPYRIAILPAGKAYVTHASLTKKLFTVSAVDTDAGVLLGEVSGIDGLCTGVAAGGEAVYLATAGAGRNEAGALRLYEIDGSTDALREIASYRAPDHGLRIAAAGDRLYAGLTTGEGAAAAVKLEIRDRRSGRLTRAAVEVTLARNAVLESLYADGQGVILVLGSGGRQEMVLADPALSAVGRRFVLSGPAAVVIGRREDIILYLDRKFETGHREVSLHFVDASAGKEVKATRIPDNLPRGGTASAQ